MRLLCLALCSILLLYAELVQAENQVLCTELSPYFTVGKTALLTKASREPSPIEQKNIDQSNLKLLNRSTSYGKWVEIVDVDNDGVEEILAINIQGSAGTIHSKIFQTDAKNKLHYQADLDLGYRHLAHLFFRLNGKNYFSYNNSHTQKGLKIASIEKTDDFRLRKIIACRTHTTLRAITACKHQACQALGSMIENPDKNSEFINIIWSGNAFPEGLEVFLINSRASGDFDNSNNPAQLLRLTSDNQRVNEHYGNWKSLAVAQAKSTVKTNTTSTSTSHDPARLTRLLAQHSKLLAAQIKIPVSLPEWGQFFLFKDDQNKTYWAWEHEQELEGPALGNNLHIIKTENRQSTYIGSIQIERSYTLAPCQSNCSAELIKGFE